MEHLVISITYKDKKSLSRIKKDLSKLIDNHLNSGKLVNNYTGEDDRGNIENKVTIQ